jgi:hypothetical protein
MGQVKKRQKLITKEERKMRDKIGMAVGILDRLENPATRDSVRSLANRSGADGRTRDKIKIGRTNLPPSLALAFSTSHF